jgi:oligosaccharide repeat unit polymerase
MINTKILFRNITIALLAPTTFMLLYDIIFYYIPILNNNYSYIDGSYLSFMLLMDFFALVIFIYFYINQKKIKNKKVSYVKPIVYLKTKWYFIIFIFIFILIHYLIIHVFGTINYNEVINNYGKFYALSKRGTAWVFYLINILMMILLYDLYIHPFNKKKLFSIVAIIAMIAATGGRSTVMTLIILLIFLHVVIHRKKLNLIILALGLSLVAIFFLANTILRADIDLRTYLEKEKSTFDFDQAYALNDVIREQDNGMNTYFIDAVDFIYMFIPRKIWEEKPMSTAATRLMYPEIANRGTSITFGLYANVLMNIGYFAFILIPLFIFLYTYLYFKVINSKDKNFINFIIVFFSINAVQLIRGGLLDTRVIRIFITLYIAYLLYKLMSTKIKRI